MNVRLFLAGALVFVAGLDSDYRRAWVVWAFGLAMIVASVLRPILDRPSDARSRSLGPQPSQPPFAERITRERQRETRERRYRDVA